MKAKLYDAYLKAVVVADDFVGRYAAPAAVAGFGVVMMTSAPDAIAASSQSNVGSMAAGISSQMAAIVNLITYACYATGVTLVGVGGMNAYKKSKGDPQVTTGSIFGSVLGGGAIAGAGALVDTMSGTLGVSGVSEFRPN